MNTNFGFVRVAAAVPMIRVADCQYNAQEVKRQIEEAVEQGVEVICFPELMDHVGVYLGKFAVNLRIQQFCCRKAGTPFQFFVRNVRLKYLFKFLF